MTPSVLSTDFDSIAKRGGKKNIGETRKGSDLEAVAARARIMTKSPALQGDVLLGGIELYLSLFIIWVSPVGDAISRQDTPSSVPGSKTAHVFKHGLEEAFAVTST